MRKQHGIILADVEDNLLDLYRLPGTSTTSHSFCNWMIYLKYDSSYKFTVSRKSLNLENIMLMVYTTNGYVTYNSRMLTDCKGEDITFTLKGITIAVVKAKILNDR